MSVFLVIAVLVALACPLHMLWQLRRGRRPATSCCGSRPPEEPDAVLERREAERPISLR